jgi:hypothetical protein
MTMEKCSCGGEGEEEIENMDLRIGELIIYIICR